MKPMLWLIAAESWSKNQDHHSKHLCAIPKQLASQVAQGESQVLLSFDAVSPSPPTICAIVVTYNRLEKFQRTLLRLLEEPLDYILVIENGSIDGTRSWLRGVEDGRVTVLEQAANGGGALGFETGLREARSRFDPDWYLVMDDDARPLSGAIAAFRATLPRRSGAVMAAVYFTDGQICEMNRPLCNPFWHLNIFLATFVGLGGRKAFHIPDAAYHASAPQSIDAGSFVGQFIPREAVARCGYPDGRMFIYGDDIYYTLRLTRAGISNSFEPRVRFEHECGTALHGAVMRPFWKAYYHHRNLCKVYKLAAGPVLFWPLMTFVLPRWLLKGGDLPPEECRRYRALIRLAVWDALRGKLDRSHPEIVDRS